MCRDIGSSYSDVPLLLIVVRCEGDFAIKRLILLRERSSVAEEQSNDGRYWTTKEVTTSCVGDDVATRHILLSGKGEADGGGSLDFMIRGCPIIEATIAKMETYIIEGESCIIGRCPGVFSGT